MESNMAAAERRVSMTQFHYDAIVAFNASNVANYTLRMNQTDVAPTRQKLNLQDNQPDR